MKRAKYGLYWIIGEEEEKKEFLSLWSQMVVVS
jgi:hypothetical protein